MTFNSVGKYKIYAEYFQQTHAVHMAQAYIVASNVDVVYVA